jgi:hypothetical protein
LLLGFFLFFLIERQKQEKIYSIRLCQLLFFFWQNSRNEEEIENKMQKLFFLFTFLVQSKKENGKFIEQKNHNDFFGMILWYSDFCKNVEAKV